VASAIGEVLCSAGLCVGRGALMSTAEVSQCCAQVRLAVCTLERGYAACEANLRAHEGALAGA
jgi:hypothetical protein